MFVFMCAYIYIECALRTFLPFSFCACHHDSCIACDMRVATLVSPQQHPARWGSMPQGCILRARANQRFSKSAFGPPGPFCNTACPQNMPPNVCLSGGNLPLRVSLSLSLTLTLSLSPSLSPSLPPSLRPSLARSFCLLSLSLSFCPHCYSSPACFRLSLFLPGFTAQLFGSGGLQVHRLPKLHVVHDPRGSPQRSVPPAVPW